MNLRIVVISDTHEQHDQIFLPEGDVLICAGDISFNGRADTITAFNRWFAAQPHRHKILIAGNHDFLFEEDTMAARRLLSDSVTYLEDSGYEIDLTPDDGQPSDAAKTRLKIWGSPITPWFFNWAFNRHRGEAIRRHWDLIPADTDVLITHGPPFGILDRDVASTHTGCEDLLAAVKRIKPHVHIFGHIHEDYGVEEHDGTIFINACQLDERYQLVNEPVVITLDL